MFCAVFTRFRAHVTFNLDLLNLELKLNLKYEEISWYVVDREYSESSLEIDKFGLILISPKDYKLKFPALLGILKIHFLALIELSNRYEFLLRMLKN